MMRRALCLLLLLPWLAHGQTTIGTQNPYVQTFGTSQTCALASVDAGALLVLTLTERDSSAEPTVSDTVNGSWGASVVTTTNARRTSIFRFINSGAGSPTITVSYGATNRVFSGICAEFNPTGTITDGNTNTANGAAATAHNAGNVTAGLGVMIGASGFESDSGGESETGGDGFTPFTMAAGEREYSRYKITTGETVDGNFTTTNAVNSGNVLVAFTDSGGGAGAIGSGLLDGKLISRMRAVR